MFKFPQNANSINRLSHKYAAANDLQMTYIIYKGLRA